MGDKKPKKPSSGSADKHKAKLAKGQAAKAPAPPGENAKKGKK